MKYIFLLLLISTSIETLAADSDAEHREALIGSWVKSKDDFSYSESRFITEFKADGTTLHKDYASSACQVLEATTTGKWSVENGFLILTVETSVGEYPLPIGAEITDKIIVINENIKILETVKGKRLLRTKSEQCL